MTGSRVATIARLLHEQSLYIHLLVRVPHRPEGFGVPLEVVLARLERAIGDEAMALVRTQLDLWTRSALTEVIEK